MRLRRIGELVIRVVAVLGADEPLAQLCPRGVQNPRLRTSFFDDAAGATGAEYDDGVLLGHGNLLTGHLYDTSRTRCQRDSKSISKYPSVQPALGGWRLV